MKTLRYACFAIISLLSVPLSAQVPAGYGVLKSTAERKTTFIDVPANTSLCPPPQITQEELNFLRQQVKERTAADALLVARENSYAAHEMLKLAEIDRLGKPQTFSLIIRALRDAETLGSREMLFYHYPAPSEYTKEIPAITPAGIPYGYPSAYACVITLTRLLIEASAKASLPKIEDYAEHTLQRRLKGGMDWPSGLTTGEDLARKYLKLLSASPDFQNALALAQAEWK